MSEPDRITIRGLDHDLYHELRVAAVERRTTTGELLNHIMRHWLELDRKLQEAKR